MTEQNGITDNKTIVSTKSLNVISKKEVYEEPLQKSQNQSLYIKTCP